VRFPLGQPVRESTTVSQLNIDGTYTLVSPDTITLTVQKPDGTQQAYPSPVSDGTGLYHQDIPVTDLTQTGHYQFAWTSAGTGAGVQPGSFDIYDPFTAAHVPPPLAGPDDVAARLGRDLTDAESLRLIPLLADASAQIRRYCRRDFLPHTAETVILYGHDSEILLPGYPVQSVDSVTAIGGGTGLPDVPIPWFIFDGIRTVRIAGGAAIINLPESWWDGDYPGTYAVTYSWGPAQFPDEVTMVCANAAIGVLTAPTAAAGVIGETIGPYSYRMESAGGGVAVSLSAADLAILKDFRDTAATVQTRLR